MRNGRSDKCIITVYDAVVLNEVLLQCFDTVGWVTWPVKISSPNDLYCVEWDVKPYSTQLWMRCCVLCLTYSIIDDLLHGVVSKLFAWTVVKLQVIACITCYLHVVSVVRQHCAFDDILWMFFRWCKNDKCYFSMQFIAPCGLWGCKNTEWRLLCFLAGGIQLSVASYRSVFCFCFCVYRVCSVVCGFISLQCSRLYQVTVGR